MDNSKNSNTWIAALKLTSPVAMGYLPFGVSYGMLGVANHQPTWLIIGLSFFVFTGSVQFTVLPMFVSMSNFVSMIISSFFVSIRQIFYALSSVNKLPNNKFKKFYCLATLTDEGYALLSTKKDEEARLIMPKVHILIRIYWLVTTIIGIVLGENFSNIPHLEFALPCLFSILVYEQFRLNKEIFPIILGIIGVILGQLILAKDTLLLGVMLFCIAILIIKFVFSKRRIYRE